MNPLLAVVFVSLGILLGVLIASFAHELTSTARMARIGTLETELKLANAIVDSVAPPVADGPDR